MGIAPVQPSRPAMSSMLDGGATIALGDVYMLAAYRKRDVKAPVGAEAALPSVRCAFAQRASAPRGATVGAWRGTAGGGGGGISAPGALSGGASIGQVMVPCVPGGGGLGWNGSTGLDRGAVELGGMVRIAALGEGDELTVPGIEVGMPQRADVTLKVVRVLGCDGAVWYAEVGL